MAAEKSAETSIIEERKKFMINITTEISTFKTGHFIKPTLSALSPLPKPPKIESLSLICKPKVYFRGNPSPLQCWESWVKQLESKHESTWRKAGIFDSIKGSTYHIKNQIDLLLCLAEKWCPECNTFVFPWGEVGITIEDVMVLGGFSPLGESVDSSSSVVDDVEKRLINWRNEGGVGSSSMLDVIQATWIQWSECFMGRGDELEHAAFLALWLSRNVFITKSSRVIRPRVFSMAARLSRGVKIALAPAVLAVIYRELRLLKEKLVHCSDYPFDVDVLCLVAPFHLVQLWAWERFPRLAPIPRMLNFGEPILARWEGVKIHYMGLNMKLDSAGETFRWRPYAMSVDNWSFPCFYDDVGKWVSVDSDEKWEMFAVCLRICQLQGFDCEDAENYNPHRVGKQFGFDQDVPCSFPISANEALQITSPELNQLIRRTKLYVPSRSFQGEVTLRYANWWNGKSFQDENDPLCVYTRRKLRSHTPSLPLLCLESLTQTECNMLKDVDLDQQNPKKRLRLCAHRNDTRSDDLPSMVNIDTVNKGMVTGLTDDDEEGGTGGGFESLVLPVECEMLENEELGTRMEQNPEKRLQICAHRNATRSDDLPSMVNIDTVDKGMVTGSMSRNDDKEEGGTVGDFKSLVLPVESEMLENVDDLGTKLDLPLVTTDKTNQGMVTESMSISDDNEEGGTVGGFESLVVPAECKMLENEDLGMKMEQAPEKKLLQLCDHQNNTTLVKGTVNDLIIISDDEEEEEEQGGRVGAFKRLFVDMEDRISKLERIFI